MTGFMEHTETESQRGEVTQLVNAGVPIQTHLV